MTSPTRVPGQIKVTTALLVFAILCASLAAVLAFMHARPTSPAVATTITVPHSMTEKEFSADVIAKIPGADVSEAKSLARSLCSIIDKEGVDYAMVVFASAAHDAKVASRSAAILAADGVSTFCPQHLEEVANWSLRHR